jgi:hypothetical protein
VKNQSRESKAQKRDQPKRLVKQAWQRIERDQSETKNIDTGNHKQTCGSERLATACFAHELDQTGTKEMNAREPTTAKENPIAARERKMMSTALSAIGVKIWDPHYAAGTETRAGASRKQK